MGKRQRSSTWSQMVLAVAGLACVTVLAVLHDISGDIALVAIVSILGVGGVHTVTALLSGTRPGVGAVHPGAGRTDATSGV